MKNLGALARAIAVVQSAIVMAGCDGKLVVSEQGTGTGGAASDASGGKGGWETSLLTSDFDVGSTLANYGREYLRVLAGPTGTASVVFRGTPRYSTVTDEPYALRAIRLLPQSGWTDLETIADLPRDTSSMPLVALDSSSSPVLTWGIRESDSDGAALWSTWWTRRSVSGWSEPAPVRGPDYAKVFSLVSNPHDGVIALFEDGTVARFSENGGWGEREVVSTYFNGGGALTVSEEGHIVSVWNDQFDSPELPGCPVCRPGLVARRWTPIDGWSPGQVLTFDVWGLLLAGNAEGRAVAMWQDGRSAWKASWFDPAQGWSEAEPAPVAPVTGLQVAMDSSGRALVVFQIHDGSDESWWAQRDPASGWSVPARLPFESDSVDMKLVGTPSGQALVVYCHGRGPFGPDYYDPYYPYYRLSASRYSPETGWTQPELVSEDAPWGYGCGPFDVAVDDAGTAVIAWLRGESADLVASVSR